MHELNNLDSTKRSCMIESHFVQLRIIGKNIPTLYSHLLSCFCSEELSENKEESGEVAEAHHDSIGFFISSFFCFFNVDNVFNSSGDCFSGTIGNNDLTEVGSGINSSVNERIGRAGRSDIDGSDGGGVNSSSSGDESSLS